MIRLFVQRLCVLGALLAFCSQAHAEDWPQWLGTKRDSIWRESGIVKTLPADGPRVLWRIPIQGGYAGPAVANGRLFLTDFKRSEGDPTAEPGVRNLLKGTERVLCVDAGTGKTLWEHAYPCNYQISYPAGPRSTPTVDGDRVYTLGAEGNLNCLNVASGSPVWSLDLNEAFKCETPYWGFSSHPLVDGNKLILVAGGQGSVAVALNKMTGEVIWKALSAKEPGYGSPAIITAGGVRQLLIWHAESVNSLNPETGSVYWSVPLVPDYGMSINVPRQEGKYLFVGGIVNKAVLLELDDSKPAVKEVWRASKDVGIGPVHSPVLLEGNLMYGVHEHGELTAVDLPTGKHLWQTFKPTTGARRGGSATAFMVKNGDRYFILSETGDLIIAKLSPTGYEEISRAALIEPTHLAFGRTVAWSHPAYANRCIFVRNDKELICASLAAE